MDSINTFLYAWFGTDFNGDTSEPVIGPAIAGIPDSISSAVSKGAVSISDGFGSISKSISDSVSEAVDEAEPWVIGAAALIALALVVLLIHELRKA